MVRGSGLEHVIFRPSFVFARGGRDPADPPGWLARLSPVTPIIGSGKRAHPADLDRRRRRQPISPEGVDKAEAANQVLRAGRPGRGQLERVLEAAEARPSASAGRAFTCLLR